MDYLILNLITNKQGEIRKFLNRYYKEETYLSDTTFRWSMICQSPIDCVLLLSTLIDNYDEFLIEAVVIINKDHSIKITTENIDFFIKYLFEMKK